MIVSYFSGIFSVYVVLQPWGGVVSEETVPRVHSLAQGELRAREKQADRWSKKSGNENIGHNYTSGYLIYSKS